MVAAVVDSSKVNLISVEFALNGVITQIALLLTELLDVYIFHKIIKTKIISVNFIN